MIYSEWSLLDRLGFIARRYGFLIVLGILFLGSLALLLILPGQRHEEVDVELLVAQMERQSRSRQVAAPAERVTTSLSIESVPAGATVLVDGDTIGTTPSSTRLESGVYVLKALAAGHVPADTVMIIDERPQHILFDLQPVPRGAPSREKTAGPEQRQPERRRPSTTSSLTRPPAGASSSTTETTGILTITSSPTDARVVVGGVEVGTTPLTTSVPTGAHEVLIRLEGYETFTARTQVGHSKAHYVHGQLERSNGSVAVLVRPWGSIYIDGELHASDTDVLYESNLATGYHVVKASHPMLGTRETPVLIREGERAQVVIEMNKPEAADYDTTSSTPG